MGAIYRVRHRLLGEERVVKVMRPHLQRDPELQDRFLAEARAATQLLHPNIAQIFDCTVDEDGFAYIVMELIRGRSLDEVLADGQPVRLPIALEISRQSLRALGHIHTQSVAHRDISPDNLMLTRDIDGRLLVKVIDLGVAKEIDGSGPATGTGMFLGKLRYAAPETFDEGAGVDRRRCDLYAFGLVLYELLTGQFPISGDTPSSLIAGHLFRPPLDFDTSDPKEQVPVPVRHAVLKALAKNPDDRFQDAGSFAAALSRQGLAEILPQEVEALLQSSSPGTITRVMRPPGSTQSRLNRQFLSGVTTPPPRDVPPAFPPADSEADHAAPRGVTSRANTDTEVTRILPASRSHGRRDQVTSSASEYTEPPSATVTLPRQPTAKPVAVQPIEEPSTDTDTHATQMMSTFQLQLAVARQANQRQAFPEAVEALEKALALAPDEPQIQPMLEEARRAAHRQQAATERELAIAKSAESITALLETGQLDEAEMELLEAGESLGTDPRWPMLRERLETRRQQLSSTVAEKTVDESRPGEESTVLLRPGSGAAPAIDRETAIAQAVERIRSLRDAGRAGDALEQLQQAVRDYGNLPLLQTLRHELGEALLARDAEEEETASQMFDAVDLPTAVDTLQTQGAVPRAAVVAAPPVPVSPVVPDLPQPSSSPPGLSEMTMRSASSVALPATERAGPPVAHSNRTLIVVGWILAAVLALTVAFLSRQGSIANKALEVQDVVAADLSPGVLVIDALPWGEVVSLENPVLEEAPPLHPSRFTPVTLRVPPGEYRITVRYPPTGQTEERVVEVTSDAQIEERIRFTDFDGDNYFEQIGW